MHFCVVMCDNEVMWRLYLTCLLFLVLFPAQALSNDEWCKRDAPPEIKIVPIEKQTMFDNSLSFIQLSAKETDTINPYGHDSTSFTFGLAQREFSLDQSTSLKYLNRTDTNQGCLWYDKITVDVELNPKISYLFDDNTRLEAFYSLGTKENSLGALEYLNKQDFGLAFSYSNAEKISFNIEAQYIKNEFEGAAFSPVAYQMLEGLQPGSNFTWNVIAQKRLTKFLDLNLSYFGRKSEDSRTIHTGTVQLRALF